MKTPVIVISGFLGSGKTTLLLKLIQEVHRRGIKPAILMNELGRQDVDGHILSQATDGLIMEKLLDGCICCSKKSEISNAITTLLSQSPDVILIELTGVANPEEVVDEMAEPRLLNEVFLQRIITVIDAENVLEYNSIFSSDKQLVHTLRRQIEVADIVIVNKRDLINDSHLSKVVKLVEKHNDKARIFTTIQTQVDFIPLLDGLQPLNLPAKKSSPFNMLSRHSHHNDGHKQNHTSFSRIQTVYIPLQQNMPLSLRKIEKFLKSWGNQILRAKGYVSVNSSSDILLIQFAGKQIQWEPSSYKGPQYIVIIGFNLDSVTLMEAWG
ncbi:putative metal chaperone YciC [compost metagenome]